MEEELAQRSSATSPGRQSTAGGRLGQALLSQVPSAFLPSWPLAAERWVALSDPAVHLQEGATLEAGLDPGLHGQPRALPFGNAKRGH